MTRGFLNHIWYKLRNEEGIPIPSASVWLYEYGNPTTELYLFDENGDALTQPISTDSDGVMEFYVKDHIRSSVYGYTWDTQFIISWSKDDKSGLIRGEHLFGEFESADLNGHLGRLNKAISNFVGWNIDNHVDFDMGSTVRCGSSSSSSSSESYTPEPDWYSIFNNSKWQQDSFNPYGIWDGSEWNSEFNTINLETVGMWANGFRPTKLRVNYYGPEHGISLYLVDESDNDITPYIGDDSYDPLVELDLDFSGVGDIKYFGVNYSTAIHITNIEFFGIFSVSSSSSSISSSSESSSSSSRSSSSLSYSTTICSPTTLAYEQTHGWDNDNTNYLNNYTHRYIILDSSYISNDITGNRVKIHFAPGFGADWKVSHAAVGHGSGDFYNDPVEVTFDNGANTSKVISASGVGEESDWLDVDFDSTYQPFMLSIYFDGSYIHQPMNIAFYDLNKYRNYRLYTTGDHSQDKNVVGGFTSMYNGRIFNIFAICVSTSSSSSSSSSSSIS
jgi:hypothetical protein